MASLGGIGSNILHGKGLKDKLVALAKLQSSQKPSKTISSAPKSKDPIPSTTTLIKVFIIIYRMIESKPLKQIELRPKRRN